MRDQLPRPGNDQIGGGSTSGLQGLVERDPTSLVLRPGRGPDGEQDHGDREWDTDRFHESEATTVS